MIAWGRSRTAKRAKCHSVDCSGDNEGFNRTTDSNKIEVIVADDQKSRELRRIRTRCSVVYLYDVVNKHA